MWLSLLYLYYYYIQDTVGELAELYRGRKIAQLHLCLVVESLPNVRKIAEEYAPPLLDNIRRYSEALTNVKKPTAYETVAGLKENKPIIPSVIATLYNLQLVISLLRDAGSRRKVLEEVKIEEETPERIQQYLALSMPSPFYSYVPITQANL